MVINKLKLSFLLLVGFHLNSIASTCYRHSDCAIDEICVSFTGCDHKQVRQCLKKTCYRSGVDCPTNIICTPKGAGHICSNQVCPLKKQQ